MALVQCPLVFSSVPWVSDTSSQASTILTDSSLIKAGSPSVHHGHPLLHVKHPAKLFSLLTVPQNGAEGSL